MQVSITHLCDELLHDASFATGARLTHAMKAASALRAEIAEELHNRCVAALSCDMGRSSFIQVWLVNLRSQRVQQPHCLELVLLCGAVGSRRNHAVVVEVDQRPHCHIP